MDPFAQPIKTLVIENDFAFTDFEDESHQDLILDASKVSIDQAQIFYHFFQKNVLWYLPLERRKILLKWNE